MQKDRLAQARKKLADLMSWAKWSGNVSREELISTAEGLATLSLSPKELVGTVAALRDQWKQMDATGGNANKEVWARFDAACSAAYAPAAKYFQDLSAQRSLNLKQAEALLTELRNQANALLDGDRNWKTIAQTCQQMQLDWKRIGQVDRKEKVHLDVEFSQIFHGLHDPLEQRQNEEMASRHALIEEALKLDAGQRSAVDRIRQLQERWQKQATALPLRRKDEQALWEKFRLACD
jgi:multidrug efflux pump subunit AcrB